MNSVIIYINMVPRIPALFNGYNLLLSLTMTPQMSQIPKETSWMSLTTLLLTCHQSELTQTASLNCKGSQEISLLFQTSMCPAKRRGSVSKKHGYWEATSSLCHCGLKQKNPYEDFLVYSGALFLSNIYENRRDIHINHNLKALYLKVFFIAAYFSNK